MKLKKEFKKLGGNAQPGLKTHSPDGGNKLSKFF